MSISSRNPAPSVPSTVSLNNPSGSRASRRPPPPLAKVVTVPPWARDEPPSPKEQVGSLSDAVAVPNIQSPHFHASDAASFQTTTDDHSRWWTFTIPRSRDQYLDISSRPHPRTERRGFRDRSISWLHASTSLRDNITSNRKDKEKGKDVEQGDDSQSITVPVPPPSTFTASHAATPGWDVPWSGKLAEQGPHPHYSHNSYEFERDEPDERASSQIRETGWPARKKQIRSFILTNAYVPLLFRFINISFTTAALGMAIHIRQIEIANHAMGAVGSSPTVVIIFAPLTLVHVMAAIYLEYFGRPLGLWRTSAKLAHTLSEVLFICAWSASLSLSFDNFFTSLLPCASPSSLNWYNELPRPQFHLETGLGPSIEREICDSQLALICLVGVGLIAYCTNLIISLYRIFEKVKYHPASRTS